MCDKHFTYILKDGQPVQSTMEQWLNWIHVTCKPSERLVKQTIINQQICVQTYFTGLDHSWGKIMPPQLYETIIRHPCDELQCYGFETKYSTWEDALHGHEVTVTVLSARNDPPMTVDNLHEMIAGFKARAGVMSMIPKHFLESRN